MRIIHLICLIKILILTDPPVLADDGEDPDADLLVPVLTDEEVAEDSDPQECTAFESALEETYNGLLDKSRRWKDFFVQIDPAYNDDEKNNINYAMIQLMNILPCVKFRVYKDGATPSGDYITIVHGTTNGCSSQLGKIGGRQVIDLQSPGCTGVGTITHEMCHALGLMHEHQRFDRDDFVTVHVENIEDQRISQFDKVSPKEFDPFGVPYNQRSIMHYWGNAFSKNQKPTITSKNGEPVGREEHLQQTDIDKLKKMYEC